MKVIIPAIIFGLLPLSDGMAEDWSMTVKRATVRVQVVNQEGTVKSSGSGVFVSPYGHILTAKHVLERAGYFVAPRAMKIQVMVLDENLGIKGTYEVKLEEVSIYKDIALLHYPLVNLKYYLTVGNINSVDEDQPLNAFGFAGGENTVLSVQGYRTSQQNWEVTIPISGGYSGGPIVKKGCRVLLGIAQGGLETPKGERIPGRSKMVPAFKASTLLNDVGVQVEQTLCTENEDVLKLVKVAQEKKRIMIKIPFEFEGPIPGDRKLVYLEDVPRMFQNTIGECLVDANIQERFSNEISGKEFDSTPARGGRDIEISVTYIHPSSSLDKAKLRSEFRDQNNIKREAGYSFNVDDPLPIVLDLFARHTLTKILWNDLSVKGKTLCFAEKKEKLGILPFSNAVEEYEPFAVNIGPSSLWDYLKRWDPAEEIFTIPKISFEKFYDNSSHAPLAPGHLVEIPEFKDVQYFLTGSFLKSPRVISATINTLPIQRKKIQTGRINIEESKEELGWEHEDQFYYKDCENSSDLKNHFYYIARDFMEWWKKNR
ncbi:MAG: serine protease [Nitrospirales bacterium]|nr:serine protease [Nitrospirales bacterium]